MAASNIENATEELKGMNIGTKSDSFFEKFLAEKSLEMKENWTTENKNIIAEKFNEMTGNIESLQKDKKELTTRVRDLESDIRQLQSNKKESELVTISEPMTTTSEAVKESDTTTTSKAELSKESENREFQIMNINIGNEFNTFKDHLRSLIRKYNPGIITIQELKDYYYYYNFEKYDTVYSEREYAASLNAVAYSKELFDKIELPFSITFNDNNKRIAFVFLKYKNFDKYFLVATIHNFYKVTDEMGLKMLYNWCINLKKYKLRLEKDNRYKKVNLIIGTDTNIAKFIDKIEKQNPDFNTYFTIYGGDKTFKYTYSTISIKKINYCYFLLGKTDEIEIETAEKNENVIESFKVRNSNYFNYLENEVNIIVSDIGNIYENIKNLHRNHTILLNHLNEGFSALYTAFQISLKYQTYVFDEIKKSQISSPILQEDLNHVSYTFLNPPACYNYVVQHPILISKIRIKSSSGR